MAKTEEELSPEAKALLEKVRESAEAGPMGTPDNENIVTLGGSLSLGLIEHNGMSKPALIISTQTAHLLSDNSMEAIIGTLTEMRKGIIVAGAGDMPKEPPKMSMIHGGRKH